MNAEIAKSILVKLKKTEDVIINKFESDVRSNLGENWDGQIVQFEIEASICGEVSLYKWIGKFSNPISENASFLEGAKTTKNELTFYSEFLPALKTFIKDRVELNFCPAYHFSLEYEGKKSFMIMENLKAIGYTIPPMVTSGLDFPHCKVLLEELGIFHAASHAFITSVLETKVGPLEAVDFLMKDFLNRDAEKVVLEFFEGFGPGRIDCARQVLESFQGEEDEKPLLERYDKLLGGRSHFEIEKDIIVDAESKFNVLVHNDLWICNLLYKSAPEQKVVILDWSVCHWNCPAVDLVNFFSTSASPDVFENHFESLLEIYYHSLSQTLTKFGIGPVYSFEDLLEDYGKMILWGSLKGFTWVPVNLANQEQLAAADLSSGFSNGSDMISRIKKVAKEVLKSGCGKERLISLGRHTVERAIKNSCSKQI